MARIGRPKGAICRRVEWRVGLSRRELSELGRRCRWEDSEKGAFLSSHLPLSGVGADEMHSRTWNDATVDTTKMGEG